MTNMARVDDSDYERSPLARAAAKARGDKATATSEKTVRQAH